MSKGKVSSIRRLLSEADMPDRTVVRRSQGPLGTVQRKMLIQEVKLLANRYSLEEHVAAFVYAREHEALTGLSLEDLGCLISQLKHQADALDVACDPVNYPPAR